MTCNPTQLDEAQSKAFFLYIDSLSAGISASRNVNTAKGLLLQRSVAYGVVQNYDAAISDLTAYIQIDSTSSLGYWQRAVCQTMMNDFNASQGVNTKLMAARTILDFDRAIN